MKRSDPTEVLLDASRSRFSFRMQGLALAEALRFRKRGVPLTRRRNTREPLFLANHFRDAHFEVSRFVHTERQGAQTHYPQPDVVINKRQVVVPRQPR